MKNKKIFSLPFFNSITMDAFDKVYIPFIEKYKDYIFDIYVTTNIDPFDQDAMTMGRGITNEIIDPRVLYLNKKFDIPLSATFNNICIPPTREILNIFLRNLEYVYDFGIRNITVPLIHWVKYGDFKKKFPGMTIKNTVLQRTKTAREFYDMAEAGYDIVILDRILLRDHKELKQVKKAQKKFQDENGRYVYLSMLGNETCEGKCPWMNEHYVYNLAFNSGLPGTEVRYMDGCYDYCVKARVTTVAEELRIANIPQWREDIEEILEYVDIIKLHGRGDEMLLKSSMKFIEDWVDGKEIIDFYPEPLKGGVFNILSKLKVPEEKVKIWRKYIKNCRFECWNCNVCEDLVK